MVLGDDETVSFERVLFGPCEQPFTIQVKNKHSSFTLRTTVGIKVVKSSSIYFDV